MTLRYWQQFPDRFLTGLCHLPPASPEARAEAPSPVELSTLVLTAPPRVGGEYLSQQTLGAIGETLKRLDDDGAERRGKPRGAAVRGDELLRLVRLDATQAMR